LTPPKIPELPRAAFGRCEDDPIRVIYTPTAQYVICLGCLVMFQPVELLSMPLFVLVGKEFVRRHRFCKPRACGGTLAPVLSRVVQAEAIDEPGAEA
jgi:hypothetical protein